MELITILTYTSSNYSDGLLTALIEVITASNNVVTQGFFLHNFRRILCSLTLDDERDFRSREVVAAIEGPELLDAIA